MIPSPQILATCHPVIVQIQEQARALQASGRPLINLGQAVPDFLPPADTLPVLAKALNDPSAHCYTPGRGLPGLRHALAAAYRHWFGVETDPETEILITAGANHAFFQALITLAAPGSRILLPSPYYFNHAMAATMSGMQPVEWPMIVRNGTYQLDFGNLEKLLQQPAALLVCINPNNPTGTIYPPEDIERLTGFCARHRLPLLFDEVYHRLCLGQTGFRHPFSLAHGRDWTVILGSFSKLFGMTGWRTGYVIAPPDVIHEMMKVQDTTVICAPAAGQILAAECLERHPDYPLAHTARLAGRCRELAAIIRSIPGLTWHDPAGALFGLAAYTWPVPSVEMARLLLQEAGILTIPGSAFGRAGEKTLRISFGHASPEVLDRLGKILPEFFSADQIRRRCWDRTGPVAEFPESVAGEDPRVSGG